MKRNIRLFFTVIYILVITRFNRVIQCKTGFIPHNKQPLIWIVRSS